MRNFMGGKHMKSFELSAGLTLITDHGGKQFDCKISFQIHHCVQPVKKPMLPFDIIGFQLSAAFHQCCYCR